MNIADYLEPTALHRSDFRMGTLGHATKFYSKEGGVPQLGKADLAVIGVCEDRRTLHNKGCASAPDEIRKHLYALYKGDYAVNLFDFGNINAGHEVEDTYFALSTTLCELLKKNIVPLIMGGSQDLTYATYLAYKKLEQVVNIVSVDSRIDLALKEEDLHSQSYLSHIVTEQPGFLFNFINLGYQAYLTDQRVVDLLGKLRFDAYRLGSVRANIEHAEPRVRDADLISFDISSIRQSEAPACASASPNGFYGEEICQIARYAGLSDKLTSMGIYEINPSLDRNGQTLHLGAQIVWHFIDGFYHRKKDFPIVSKKNFLKYIVNIKGMTHEIVFYKSKKSDRWWMDIPYPGNKNIKYARHHLVPCSYEDYQMACKEQLPETWWKTYDKLN